jgi:hypothetical protein
VIQAEPVAEGDKVVVALGTGIGRLVYPCVVSNDPVPHPAGAFFRVSLDMCPPRLEGITWARGWEGLDADAFVVAVALGS